MCYVVRVVLLVVVGLLWCLLCCLWFCIFKTIFAFDMGLLCRFGLILRCWGVGFAVCLLLFFGGFDLCGLDPYGVC